MNNDKNNKNKNNNDSWMMKTLGSELVNEITKQLNLADINITNLQQLLSTQYIEPYSHPDMVGYVELGSRYYYLKVRERGVVIIEYQVLDKREAAYWILKQLLYLLEYNKRRQEYTDYLLMEHDIETACLCYFQTMDPIYHRWHQSGRNIYNFDT